MRTHKGSFVIKVNDSRESNTPFFGEKCKFQLKFKFNINILSGKNKPGVRSPKKGKTDIEKSPIISIDYGNPKASKLGQKKNTSNLEINSKFRKMGTLEDVSNPDLDTVPEKRNSNPTNSTFEEMKRDIERKKLKSR